MTDIYNNTRKVAVDSIIEWAKTGMKEITMRDAINDYFTSCGANIPSIGGKETIIAHRKMAANRLALDCMFALNKKELSKVDKKLEAILLS